MSIVFSNRSAIHGIVGVAKGTVQQKFEAAAALLESKSDSGKAILKAVKDAAREVHVIIKAGYGDFEDGIDCDHSEIFWDPDKTTEVILGVEAVDDGWTYVETLVLPAYVILAHELGHAKQLIEKTETYRDWLTRYASAVGEANKNAVLHGELEKDNISTHENAVVKDVYGKATRLEYGHFWDSTWHSTNVKKIKKKS